MNREIVKKAKELIKSLYGDKNISFKEVAGIYHQNMNFICELADNKHKTWKFYRAIDKIYYKKLGEYRLDNGKQTKEWGS